MHATRLFHTIRHLKPVQVYGRLTRPLIRPRPRPEPAPPLRPPRAGWVKPAERRVSLIGPGRVKFLNEIGEIATSDQWNDPARSALWLYNLHYFDDLNAPLTLDRTPAQSGLVARWIAENPPGTGLGWEPYPLSLRIANWIKWALAENTLPATWQDSLAVQARYLEASIEWHLLGNHLLANAKALALAGLFFEGPEARRWLGLGTRIYARQLPEQILPDGGHFERSPMYHAIILEDLLDLFNASRTYGTGDLAFFAALPEAIGRMRSWLRAMVHPDGEIAFFNDAAFGIGAPPGALDAYAVRLGLGDSPPARAGTARLVDSGYVRLDLDDACVLLDLAPVGPDYLPGHAHADTLSFELSVGAERIVVNGGTSEYGTGHQRRRERLTAAHSTVEIDGADSSEVWSGFRVARRARVFDVVVSGDTIPAMAGAAHDGYRRLPGRPTHRRMWCGRDRSLAVTDTVDGRFREATARFHLGAGVTAEAGEGGRRGRLRTAGGRALAWRSSAPARIEPSEWHPEFGLTIATQCLEIPLAEGHLETEFDW